MKQVFKSVPVEEITPNPQQPRKTFEPEAMESLIESIRDQGLIQPIIVREGKGSYMIIAGERRWQAAIEAGLREVPVIITDTDEKNLLPSALIENLIREDLNPVEEAEAFKRLSGNNWTQDSIAKMAGMTRATVANSIRLLELEDEIKEMMRKGEITAGHGKALLMLPAEKRLAAAKDILRFGLSVRAIENMSKPRQEKVKKRLNTIPELRFLEERIRRTLGVKIEIRGNQKKGKITLEYYNETDLEKIIGRLNGQ